VGSEGVMGKVIDLEERRLLRGLKEAAEILNSVDYTFPDNKYACAFEDEVREMYKDKGGDIWKK